MIILAPFTDISLTLPAGKLNKPNNHIIKLPCFPDGDRLYINYFHDFSDDPCNPLVKWHAIKPSTTTSIQYRYDYKSSV